MVELMPRAELVSQDIFLGEADIAHLLGQHRRRREHRIGAEAHAILVRRITDAFEPRAQRRQLRECREMLSARTHQKQNATLALLPKPAISTCTAHTLQRCRYGMSRVPMRRLDRHEAGELERD